VNHIIYHDLEYIYIHWPFCPYKCHFCDFVAIASHEEFMQQYHDALLQEIEQFISLHRSTSVKAIRTVYIGGGTPSTWPVDLLAKMFEKLRVHFSFRADAEITLEVNPGTVTEEKVQAWKKVGITRLSIGVQSLNDIVLKKLNRHQTAVDVEYVLSTASAYFENISVDFIVGLPEISFEDWKSYILHAMKWPIKHISVYFLTVHEKTPLYFKVQQNKISLPPDDITVDMYEWLVATLQDHGFLRYEISNFAKPGYESKHNASYWNRSAYKGFGLGACSFNGIYRYRNTKNLNSYIQSQGLPGSLIEEIEELSDHQVLMEKIMLGLRQARGIDMYDIIYTYTALQKEKFFQGVQLLQEKGLLQQHDGFLKLTPQGYALENEVAVRLFP